MSCMEIVIICLSAFFTAVLTFFSGFGLGTILAPVFAIFFPIDIAIALTGVVHFSNNLFKMALVGKNTDKAVAKHSTYCSHNAYYNLNCFRFWINLKTAEK